LVFVNKNIKTDDMIKKIQNYIKSVEGLDLYAV
jgi:ribosomal protein L30/L7E